MFIILKVIPVGPCVNGAPVFLSLPHFQGAPPEYAKSVAGLDKEGKYESVVDIQPVRVITFHPILLGTRC